MSDPFEFEPLLVHPWPHAKSGPIPAPPSHRFAPWDVVCVELVPRDRDVKGPHAMLASGNGAC